MKLPKQIHDRNTYLINLVNKYCHKMKHYGFFGQSRFIFEEESDDSYSPIIYDHKENILYLAPIIKYHENTIYVYDYVGKYADTISQYDKFKLNRKNLKQIIEKMSDISRQYKGILIDKKKMKIEMDFK